MKIYKITVIHRQGRNYDRGKKSSHLDTPLNFLFSIKNLHDDWISSDNTVHKSHISSTCIIAHTLALSRIPWPNDLNRA